MWILKQMFGILKNLKWKAYQQKQMFGILAKFRFNFWYNTMHACMHAFLLETDGNDYISIIAWSAAAFLFLLQFFFLFFWSKSSSSFLDFNFWLPARLLFF
jgi:hypothetical protein